MKHVAIALFIYGLALKALTLLVAIVNAASDTKKPQRQIIELTEEMVVRDKK